MTLLFVPKTVYADDITYINSSISLVSDNYDYVGKVSYVPGYGIRVYKVEGNDVTPIDKFLSDGTLWKVFGNQNINGVSYSNVGGNQWVQSAYLPKYVAPSWDGKTYVTIGYVPGYGIAVYQEPGNFATNVSGKFLPNGSCWKVVGQRQVNGKAWFQVGTDNWVNGDNVVSGPVNTNSIKQNVPYRSQYTPINAPWGCAVASMAMLVGYEGSVVDMKYALDNLPMYPTPGGQLGNVYTGAGFGHVINSVALTKYAQKWNANVRDVSGASVETIKNLVLSGHPVLYYGFSSYQKDSNRNHCKVIVGYDNDNFLIHDPLYYSANAGASSGGTKRLGYNNGYDNGAISWENLSKFSNEYAGSAISIK